MSDEQLWRPRANSARREEEDSDADAELFDTDLWHPDPNPQNNARLESVGLFPLWQPEPGQWHCKYGCPGVDIAGTRIDHSWNCPYWRKEGKDKTPF